MKKALMTMLALAMALLLFACAAPSSTPKQTTDVVNAPAETNEPAKPEEPTNDETVYTLVYGHMSNPTDLPGQMAENLAALVKEKSNGRLIIEVYPSSQIGTQAELPEMVQTGTIAMTHTTQSVLGNWYYEFSALDTPYLYDSVDQLLAVNAMDSPLITRLTDELVKASGVRLLYNYYAGARQLTCNKAIYSPDDLAGLKIRAIAQPMYVCAVEGMGAVATPLDWSEVITSLGTGLIDGQENPADVLFANNMWEVQDYVMKTGHFLFTGAVVINDEIFQSLPADLQQILLECCEEIQLSTSNSFVEKEEGLLKQCAENGMTIISEEEGLDLAAFKESVAKKVDETFGEKYAEIYKEIESLKTVG